MDEFVEAMKEVFPNLLVQFEDFSTDNAFRYLDRYRDTYRVFNDDVGSLLFNPYSDLSPYRSKELVPSSCLASSMPPISRLPPQRNHWQTIEFSSLGPVLLALV